MTAASRASVVIGFPSAGPTCFAITLRLHGAACAGGL